MQEIICYVVKRPDEPLDISRLRRDRTQAWRDYMGNIHVDAYNIYEVRKQVRKRASMEGVRLHCYRLVPSGTADTVEY